MKKICCVILFFVFAATSLPLESSDSYKSRPASSPVQHTAVEAQTHHVQRRFINPLFSLGMPEVADIAKMRTKRSYDECEKLQLCKLHARSRNSFFATFELYFVNKENAQLWDHRARTAAECEQRFGDCYNK